MQTYILLGEGDARFLASEYQVKVVESEDGLAFRAEFSSARQEYEAMLALGQRRMERWRSQP